MVIGPSFGLGPDGRGRPYPRSDASASAILSISSSRSSVAVGRVALQRLGLRITEVAFGASFRAPAKAGLYRFSALVAPYRLGGSAATDVTYRMRGV
jgi:hypothetical protein